jgi:hypothetical protein
MPPNPLENYLARAAWIIADTRSYLKTLPNSSASSLCERIDDFFLETYFFLKKQEGTTAPPSTFSAPPAESIGPGWNAPPGGWESLPLASSTELDGLLEGVFSIPTKPTPETSAPPPAKSTSKPKKAVWVDFF